MTELVLSPPTTIQGIKKSEKIVYSDIVSNGKKGIYVNLNSKTPEHKPTFHKFNDKNMYVYIKYTDELEMALMDIVEKVDVESNEALQDKFLIAGVLDKYKEDGYIKAKVDILKFNTSFFQTIEEGKKGKTTFKNLPYEDFESESTITNGIYSLKIGGVWRKENSPCSGFSIKVLAVLANAYHKNANDDEENDDAAFKELLKLRNVKIE